MDMICVVKGELEVIMRQTAVHSFKENNDRKSNSSNMDMTSNSEKHTLEKESKSSFHNKTPHISQSKKHSSVYLDVSARSNLIKEDEDEDKMSPVPKNHRRQVSIKVNEIENSIDRKKGIAINVNRLEGDLSPKIGGSRTKIGLDIDFNAVRNSYNKKKESDPPAFHRQKSLNSPAKVEKLEAESPSKVILINMNKNHASIREKMSKLIGK